MEGIGVLMMESALRTGDERDGVGESSGETNCGIDVEEGRIREGDDADTAGEGGILCRESVRGASGCREGEYDCHRV